MEATVDQIDHVLAPVAPGRLVAEARRGSATACASLHRRYAAMVHGLLLARHDAATADDLTQECFLLAFQRLGQLREPEKFGGWLASIARRLRDNAEPGHASLDSLPEPIDPGSSPEQHSEAWGVLQAIRALPMAYRETLILRLVEGMSGPEIAAQTGLDPGSVRVNLHRGMQKLRERLQLASPQEDSA